MVRMPIVEYLRDCGYNVVEAGDAMEAIEAMDAPDRINLVFSDIRMPGKMDGLDLAKWFNTYYPDVPVLLTSGYTGGRSLPASSGPVRGFIAKPYRQTQVAQRIAGLLDA